MPGDITIQILDGNGAALALKGYDTGAGLEFYHRFDSAENHIGEMGGRAAIATATFTRPANTTAYASGNLVANSVTAGSVVPMALTVGRTSTAPGSSGMVRRAKLYKSGTSITNASFRIHFYTVNTMTFANGDGGAWSTNLVANYKGSIDVTMDKAFTDGAIGHGVPNAGSEINFDTQTLYAVVEARAAYTPASAEVFTLHAEVLQN